MAYGAGAPLSLPNTPSFICQDLKVMQRALQDLREGKTEIEVGESGTAARFLLLLIAFTSHTPCTLLACGRLPRRPMMEGIRCVEELLGAECRYPSSSCFFPLQIIPGKVRESLLSQPFQYSGESSSQFLSALLMLSPYLPKGLRLSKQSRTVSASYVQLTLQWMKRMGATVLDTDSELLILPSRYDAELLKQALATPIPDWSSAGYLYQWVACAPYELSLRVPYLEVDDQPDSGIAYWMCILGVETISCDGEAHSGVMIRRTKDFPSMVESLRQEPREYDFSEMPDSVPTWVVTLLILGIPFQIVGIDHLRYKESDRIEELITMALKNGYSLEYRDGALISEVQERGTLSNYPTFCIPTPNDHRMVMAWAAQVWRSPIEVLHPQSVEKSFPMFWNYLSRFTELYPSSID